MPVSSRQRWAVLGSIALGCFLLTLAAGAMLRQWKRRPVDRPRDLTVVGVSSASPGAIRPGVEDVPAHLDVPSGIVLAEKEWAALKEAWTREGFDEVRFSLTKFRRIGLDASPVLVPVLRSSNDDSERLLAFAALAHAVPPATDGDPLGAIVLSEAAGEVLADPGRSLASAALVDPSRARRTVALLALGAPSLPWGLEDLARYLEDAGTKEETDLLILAVRSAAASGGTDATRLLVSLLVRPLPADVKREVASLLSAQPTGEAAAEIERLIGQAQDAEAKVVLAGVLTDLAAKEGSTARVTDRLRGDLRPVLAATVADPNAADALKAQAVHALGGLGDEESLEAVVSAMKTLVTPDLVSIAAGELARHGERVHGYQLVEGFDGSLFNVNELHRLGAAIAIAERTRQNDLRMRAVEKGEPYLRRLLLETQHGSLKAIAMPVLASMGPQTANPILWDVVANGNERADVRLRALEQLQETGGPKEMQALMALEKREENQRVKDRIRQTLLALEGRHP